MWKNMFFSIHFNWLIIQKVLEYRLQFRQVEQGTLFQGIM